MKIYHILLDVELYTNIYVMLHSLCFFKKRGLLHLQGPISVTAECLQYRFVYTVFLYSLPHLRTKSDLPPLCTVYVRFVPVKEPKFIMISVISNNSFTSVPKNRYQIDLWLGHNGKRYWFFSEVPLGDKQSYPDSCHIINLLLLLQYLSQVFLKILFSKSNPRQVTNSA